METVKVIRTGVPGGFAIINKKDLKPDDVLHIDDAQRYPQYSVEPHQNKLIKDVMQRLKNPKYKPDLKNCKPCAQKRKRRNKNE